jgi:hypothetical protein
VKPEVEPKPHEIYDVVGFTSVGPYTLEIKFGDGLRQTVDFRGVLEGELYGPLKDQATEKSISRSCPPANLGSKEIQSSAGSFSTHVYRHASVLCLGCIRRIKSRKRNYPGCYGLTSNQRLLMLPTNKSKIIAISKRPGTHKSLTLTSERIE